MTAPAGPERRPAAIIMPSSVQGKGYRVFAERAGSVGRMRKLSRAHANDAKGSSAVAAIAYGSCMVLTANETTAAVMHEPAPYMSVRVVPI